MKNKDKIILNKILCYIREIIEFIEEYDKIRFNNDKKL